MPKVFITEEILQDTAEAIRYVDGSLSGISPSDFAERIRVLKYYNSPWLNFTMPEGGTVTLTKTGTPTEVTLEYSLDNGITWTEWVESDNVRTLVLDEWQTMHVRNTSETSTQFSTSDSNYYNFAFSSDTYAGGNTDSLLCKNIQDSIIRQYCFYGLFRNATYLLTAPNLPNTLLYLHCYYKMFYNCTSLVKAPNLPALKLYACCYRNMFSHCSSLEVPPVIAATTFSSGGVKSYYCASMFYNCTALKETPILNPNILDDEAYYWMFGYCSNLKKVTTYMTDISAVMCLYNWLSNASPTGDFYCPAELTIPTGASGIPSGWTRHNIDGDKYLNFTMPDGGTITLTKNGTPTEVTLEYLIEGDPNWVTWAETNNVRSLTLSAGGKVYIRNTSETSTGFSTGNSTTDKYRFSFSDYAYGGGNINSLLCKNPENAVITENCFNRLFLSTKLVTAPALPSTEIARTCYNYMFRECRQLVTAPEVLPATTIYPYCYYYMFEGCISLVKAPKILAESITAYACGGMFRNDTLLNYIYTEMTEITSPTSIASWVDGVAATGDFYCPAELTIPTGVSGIPSGWTRHDYPDNTWLHFKMPEGGTVSLTKNGTPTEVTLEYSLDNGSTWTEWVETENVRSLTLAAGQTIHVRNTSETSTRFSTSSNDYYNFAFTADTYVGGNTDSLLCKNTQDAIIIAYCYFNLFRNCANLMMSDTFTLPSTKIENFCYHKMFENCTSLTMSNTFTLPSTTLANGCYYRMFANCTNLTMGNSFSLPATTLGEHCYYAMFLGCKKLILPETFVLSVKTLVTGCYLYMFYGCSILNKLKTEMTDISAYNCLYEWLYNVSPTGDFYCPAELTIPTGTSGIPSGWTRHDYPDNTWLHFKMPEGGTVSLTKNGTPTAVTLEYSLDNGNTWTEWVETENVRSLTLASGQTMHVRNTSETSTGFSTWPTSYYNFSFSADTYAGGDLRSLLCKNPENATSTNSIFCFYSLFKNATYLIEAKIKLLFTDLPRSFYREMFYGCSNLIEVPETITATTCSGGDQQCYRMFYYCTKITKLPKLTLLQIPEYGYGQMAAGCTRLNYVYTEMTDISETSCLSSWLYQVSATGDFYCPAELTIPTGANGIPRGWTRHDLPTT